MGEEDKHASDDGFISRGAIKSMTSGEAKVETLQHEEGRWSLLEPASNDLCGGLCVRPLPCFGCGIGWFLFVSGFAFPLLWYIAAALFLVKYQFKDPREREGLAAAAIAALICTVLVLITLFAVYI